MTLAYQFYPIDPTTGSTADIGVFVQDITAGAIWDALSYGGFDTRTPFNGAGSGMKKGSATGAFLLVEGSAPFATLGAATPVLTDGTVFAISGLDNGNNACSVLLSGVETNDSGAGDVFQIINPALTTYWWARIDTTFPPTTLMSAASVPGQGIMFPSNTLDGPTLWDQSIAGGNVNPEVAWGNPAFQMVKGTEVSMKTTAYAVSWSQVALIVSAPTNGNVFALNGLDSEIIPLPAAAFFKLAGSTAGVSNQMQTTVEQLAGGVILASWIDVTENDTPTAVSFPMLELISAEAYGTYGGATLTIEGVNSDDGSGTYAPLIDRSGTAGIEASVVLTADGIKHPVVDPLWVKPVFSGGSGQLVTVRMLFKPHRDKRATHDR